MLGCAKVIIITYEVYTGFWLKGPKAQTALFWPDGLFIHIILFQEVKLHLGILCRVGGGEERGFKLLNWHLVKPTRWKEQATTERHYGLLTFVWLQKQLGGCLGWPNRRAWGKVMGERARWNRSRLFLGLSITGLNLGLMTCLWTRWSKTEAQTNGLAKN